MVNSATCSKQGATEIVAPFFIMKLKILQLAPLYRPLVFGIGYGSIERLVMGLDSEFTKRGIDSHISALDGSSIHGKLLKCPDAEDYEAQAEVVLGFLKKQGADIIHIHRRSFLQTQAFTFCIAKNIPVLYTIHGLAEDLKKKMDFPINKSHNLFFNAVSFYQAKDLSELFPMEEIIYNGVDTNLYNYPNDQKRNYFLSIGRLNKEKGAHTAIQLAKKARVPLVIAGNIADRNYFEQDIKPYVDNKNIKFLGELADHEKIPLYQNALAVLMLGTYNDPCPLVAMESMACGTPVIAFRKGGIPEIVQDGITGILLDSVDDGLKRMKDLPSINNKKCRDVAEREFSLTRMADRYFALYLRLVEKIKKRGA